MCNRGRGANASSWMPLSSVVAPASRRPPSPFPQSVHLNPRCRPVHLRPSSSVSVTSRARPQRNLENLYNTLQHRLTKPLPYGIIPPDQVAAAPQGTSVRSHHPDIAVRAVSPRLRVSAWSLAVASVGRQPYICRPRPTSLTATTTYDKVGSFWNLHSVDSPAAHPDPICRRASRSSGSCRTDYAPDISQP